MSCTLICFILHHHHHTVQVVMCAYLFVCTLVNVLVLQVKPSPGQVAAGDDNHACKWIIITSWWKEKHHQHNLQQMMTTMTTSGVFALVNGRKNTTSASCTVSRPSWAQVYRSRMQQPNAGSTRARFALRWCPYTSCIWLLYPTPIDTEVQQLDV